MPTEPTINPLMQIVPYLFIFVVFYFIVFRPQKKEQNALKLMRSALKKNDEIVTTSGIHGTIVLIKDKTVMVRVDDNVKIEFDKEAVATILKESV